MIANPLRSETIRSRSGFSWLLAIAKWVAYSRTSSYSTWVSRMVAVHDPSLHSQMYGSPRSPSRLWFPSSIHSLISRDRVSLAVSVHLSIGEIDVIRTTEAVSR